METLQCAFCGKLKDETELIEMATNSIIINDEMIEFTDLIRNLLFLKIQNESTSCICEYCKNLLVQFYMFKETARTRSEFCEIENFRKILNFLDENDEEIFCTRYNKCLTLVPQSKRKFNEVFQQWQPQVVMEKIEEFTEFSEPLEKMRKVEKDVVKSCVEIEKNCVEIETKIMDFPEEIEESKEEGFSENEWVQIEIDNSDMIETEVGTEWLCKYCEPGPVSFIDLDVFRSHLLTTHLSYEQIVMDLGGDVEGEEMIVEEYDSELIEQSDFEEKPVIRTVKPEVSLSLIDLAEQKPKKSSPEKSSTYTRYEKLVCDDCNYQFAEKAHYQAHLNGHQLYETVAKHIQFPICGICNTMFSDESFELLHTQKHENGENFSELIPAEGTFLRFGQSRSQNFDEIEEGTFSCGHCPRKFNDEESCRLHQLIFHVSILKCPVENREFKGNQAFSIHLKNNHPEMFGLQSYQCSVCKAEFENLFDKLKHMKICDQKKYACHHCDKKFSKKCYLTNHLKLVSGQSSVVCEICDKVCRDKGDYQIHHRSHTNIKPFQCSLCPKAYKTSSARAAHLETHNADGFDCDFCTVKFKSRRTLHKHIRTKHPAKHFEIA